MTDPRHILTAITALAVVVALMSLSVGGALGTTAPTSGRARVASSTPIVIKTGTPRGCLFIAGLVNAHGNGRGGWEGFDTAYGAWIWVHGQYRSATAAAAAARVGGRNGFALTANRYAISAPMGMSMARQVRAVASCLKQRVRPVGYTF